MSSGAWNNPPPPGTMDDAPYNRSSTDKVHEKSIKESYRRYSRSRSRSNEDYNGSRSRSYSRSRSRSPARDYPAKRLNDHHRRSPKRSKDYHRRSRSKSYSPSHKRYRQVKRSRYSKSRSNSRSRSYSRHNRRSRSYSRSYSRSRHSRTRSRSLSSSSYSDRESSLYRNKRSKINITEIPKDQNYIRKVYSKQNDDVPVQENTFKNDGSFLEMFKKMQEEKAAAEKKVVVKDEASVSNPEVKKTAVPIFGKRRGGKVLKTGMVQKLKNPNEIEEEPKDAWSVYMKEVKRYKEACCDDDSKTRPLVK